MGSNVGTSGGGIRDAFMASGWWQGGRGPEEEAEEEYQAEDIEHKTKHPLRAQGPKHPFQSQSQ